MGVAHRLLDPARRLALDPGDAEGLVHGLVPGLLLGGGVHGRLAGTGAGARAGVGVEDLACAGRIMARRRTGCAIAVLGVLLLAFAVTGGIGRIVGFIADPGGRRLPARPSARGSGTLGCVAVVTGIVLPGLRQAVVCLLDAHAYKSDRRRGAQGSKQCKRRRISKRTVDGLSVEDKDTVFWDLELLGFGVRVYPSGSKVYVVQCRTAGGPSG